ncbi:MAG: hypothetical protein HY295_02335 [Thaumarchaeota archaeon]|nr:hypothetical protein [Nitrososphaerota archaeon]
MTRVLLFLLGAIPVLAAIFIVIPQLTKPEIPITAADSNDVISVEYSKQHLKKVTFGLTETIGAQKTDLLLIQNDGGVTYSVTKNGYPEPDVKYNIEKSELKKLTALIKETGFMQIPPSSFPIKSGVDEYDKFGIKVTLNGKSTNIQWPEQNATETFIPPLFDAVKSQLEGIIGEIIK